jgi:hypothetical protein
MGNIFPNLKQYPEVILMATTNRWYARSDIFGLIIFWIFVATATLCFVLVGLYIPNINMLGRIIFCGLGLGLFVFGIILDRMRKKDQAALRT